MDTMAAVLRAEYAKARGEVGRVFDWHKAAEIIRERKPVGASAGLQEDWEWTGGMIFENGELVKDHTYLASIWAIPELTLEFADGSIETIECFIMQDNNPEEWGAYTSWPDSAVKVLKGE